MAMANSIKFFSPSCLASPTPGRVSFVASLAEKKAMTRGEKKAVDIVYADIVATITAMTLQTQLRIDGKYTYSGGTGD